MDAPRRQLEDEHGVVRHQPASGPDFRREKVCRHESGPMRAEKRAPGGRPLTTGWDAFRFQDVRDRGSSHAMAHVLQRPLNPRVAPGRILCGHPHHQTANLGEHPRSPWSPPGVGPFPRNQFAMPSKNRVRLDERGNLEQCGASEPLPQHRETPPLRIVQPRPPAGQLRLSARDSPREGTRSHHAARARAIRAARRGTSVTETRGQSTSTRRASFRTLRDHRGSRRHGGHVSLTEASRVLDGRLSRQRGECRLNYSHRCPKGESPDAPCFNQAANAAVKARGTIFAVVSPSRAAARTCPSHRRHHPSPVSIDVEILHERVRYEERGRRFSAEAKNVRARKMIRELRGLGYRVELL